MSPTVYKVIQSRMTTAHSGVWKNVFFPSLDKNEPQRLIQAGNHLFTWDVMWRHAHSHRWLVQLGEVQWVTVCTERGMWGRDVRVSLGCSQFPVELPCCCVKWVNWVVGYLLCLGGGGEVGCVTGDVIQNGAWSDVLSFVVLYFWPQCVCLYYADWQRAWLVFPSRCWWQKKIISGTSCFYFILIFDLEKLELI